MSDFKVLVVGDTHMNYNWYVQKVIPFALENDCKTIFQVGDFGFWDNQQAGRFFLTELSKLLVENNIRLVFLLGNHEDWKNIENYRIAEQSSEGFRKVRENLWWAPCGLQWKWKKTSFGAVGGAYSIDRDVRELNYDYFEEEVITDEKAADIIDMTEPESVDIMFAHDVGSYVDMMHHMYVKKNRRIFAIEASFNSRRQLQKIINHWQPHTFIHGHWHICYQDRVDDVNYYGLECEYHAEESFVLLSIKDDEAAITVPSHLYAKRIPIRAMEAA